MDISTLIAVFLTVLIPILLSGFVPLPFLMGSAISKPVSPPYTGEVVGNKELNTLNTADYVAIEVATGLKPGDRVFVTWIMMDPVVTTLDAAGASMVWTFFKEKYTSNPGHIVTVATLPGAKVELRQVGTNEYSKEGPFFREYKDLRYTELVVQKDGIAYMTVSGSSSNCSAAKAKIYYLIGYEIVPAGNEL